MTLSTVNADEALARINCYGIGAWLEITLQSLGQTLPDASLVAGATRTTARAAGLVLTLSRVASTGHDPRDSLVLARVEGDRSAPMPCNLDPTTETLASATAKLSHSTAGGAPSDIAAGDRRVSYFLDGARVVELRFTPGLVGFDRIVLARLGAPVAWHPSAKP